MIMHIYVRLLVTFVDYNAGLVLLCHYNRLLIIEPNGPRCVHGSIRRNRNCQSFKQKLFRAFGGVLKGAYAYLFENVL